MDSDKIQAEIEHQKENERHQEQLRAVREAREKEKAEV